MHNDQRNLETIPTGALGIIPLESCREIGEKVANMSMKTTLHSKDICVIPM